MFSNKLMVNLTIRLVVAYLNRFFYFISFVDSCKYVGDELNQDLN